MAFIIRDADGVLFFTDASSGSVTRCVERKLHRTVIHDLPGANKDLLQKVGTKNRRFRIQGDCLHASGSAWLRALPGTTGSVSYTDSRGHVFLPLTNVFYISVDLQDRAGRPFERKFTLEAVEKL